MVLAGMFATTLPIVHLYSTGVMLPSLVREFGWSRAEVSSGPAIISVTTVLLAPLVGLAIDRVGPRRIGLVGAASFCLVLAAFSLVTDDLVRWWALWTALGIAAAAVSPAVWAAGVSSLFFSARGMALAVTLTGTGLGAVTVPVVATRLVEAVGWRHAYFGLALIWALATLPLLWLFFYGAADRRRAGRTAPAPPALITAAPTGRLLLSRRYLTLVLAAASVTLASNGMMLSLVPMLTDRGMSAIGAAALAGIAGAGSMCGRLGGGVVIDRIDARFVGAGAAVVLAAAIVLLLAGSSSVPAGAIVFALGLTVGVEYDVVAYLVARHFGLASFGALFGTITGIIALTAGVGPLLASILYDRTGSYAAVPWLFVPLAIVALVSFVGLGPYPAVNRPDCFGR